MHLRSPPERFLAKAVGADFRDTPKLLSVQEIRTADGHDIGPLFPQCLFQLPVNPRLRPSGTQLILCGPRGLLARANDRAKSAPGIVERPGNVQADPLPTPAGSDDQYSFA